VFIHRSAVHSGGVVPTSDAAAASLADAGIGRTLVDGGGGLLCPWPDGADVAHPVPKASVPRKNAASLDECMAHVLPREAPLAQGSVWRFGSAGMGGRF
jgi:hypothetical protein